MGLALEVITSFKNPKVQRLRGLISQRSYRDETGQFVIEGVRLVEEAITRHFLPQSVYFSENLSARGIQLVDRLRQAGVEVFEVSGDILNRLSDTETSQGILAVLPQELIPLTGVAEPVLVIDQVRDPGNLGTILRSAAAAAAGAVLLAPGSVDPFMPKVVRAGMGAHFHLPICQTSWDGIEDYCKRQAQPPLQVLLAEAGSGLPMWQADLTRPLALVIGGEAEGAGEEARALSDAAIRIPMPGDFESLNAGVAASLLLYEVLRQRSA